MIERPRLLQGEDLPSEPKQVRSKAKRAKLKAAALELFGERGYEATSIEEIAGRAKTAVGGFYLHFRSKRQLLLVLMEDLLKALSSIDLRPGVTNDPREGIRRRLASAFSHDLRYLGAYRAWREAALSDPGLAHKQAEIHAWTTARVALLFEFLAKLPGARQGLDVAGLATAMDTFFWSLLSQAGQLTTAQLEQQLDTATHLIYHALFTDGGVQGVAGSDRQP